MGPSVSPDVCHRSAEGGKFLALSVRGCADREVACADKRAPTHRLDVEEGYVPYRHDTLVLRKYSAGTGRNCLLEALMAGTGFASSAALLLSPPAKPPLAPT